eukprot:15855-Heterococcus_DN1.PRE.1
MSIPRSFRSAAQQSQKHQQASETRSKWQCSEAVSRSHKNQRSFNDHDLKLELFLHCRSQYVVPVAITTVLTAVRASM